MSEKSVKPRLAFEISLALNIATAELSDMSVAPYLVRGEQRGANHCLGTVVGVCAREQVSLHLFGSRELSSLDGCQTKIQRLENTHDDFVQARLIVPNRFSSKRYRCMGDVGLVAASQTASRMMLNGFAERRHVNLASWFMPCRASR